MKIKLPVTLCLCLLIISCNPQSFPPTNSGATPTQSISTPSKAATPTLNFIEQAVATQNAERASQPTATPVTARTDVSMPSDGLRVSSPDGRINILFGLINGAPYYAVKRGDADVILPSKLGFTFLMDAPLDLNLMIISSDLTSVDETWTQPWGEVKEIRDHHNELRVELSEQSDKPRRMILVFRAFDDGIGFRYELPEQSYLHNIQIMKEETEFALAGDHSAWWIPAFQDNRYEYLYKNTTVSRLSASAKDGVHTPLTMQTADGLYLSIHEAALLDYSSMALQADGELVLQTRLFPWSDGVLVKSQTPFKTPWRTIQIAENPGDLITSYLILNLNEPNQLGDVSWVHPQKYIGIWWGMHLGKWSWNSGPGHGATTENTEAYLDFAAKNGFAGVLVEGWNEGWDGDWVTGGDRFDFTTSYSDFDLKDLAVYADSLGVKLIGHHETGAAVINYENQMEEAFALYRSLGIDTIKTGYVGYGQGIKRYDEQGNLVGYEWHHGQYMVEHYQRVIETAARYHIMINAHEPIKDTGLRRTYPNFLAREGARGQEYNAWDYNPPDHVTILPFTRLLSGPMDYTPGILDLTFDQYRPSNRVSHTLAKELALYVVIYSPLQMAADLIENYEGNPAFQFILDAPVDWNDTRVLNAQIGDYITTVRQERDGDEWFLGSITDENPRTLDAPLDFLTPDVVYVAQIYADGAGADWDTNPYVLDISRVLVDSNTVLSLKLAAGGGEAIRFYPASAKEVSSLPSYQP